jgi:hypothetical protein
VNARSGLLTHIQALESLSRDRSSVANSIWVIRLLIILVDSMPILVRLIQSFVGRRSYDVALGALQYEEELNAERLRERAELDLQLARDAAARRLEATRELAELELVLTRAAAEHRAQQELERLWAGHPTERPGMSPASRETPSWWAGRIEPRPEAGS